MTESFDDSGPFAESNNSAFTNSSTLEDSVGLDGVPAVQPTTEHKARKKKKKKSGTRTGESRGHREGGERKSLQEA